jgi:hypothetical protein
MPFYQNVFDTEFRGNLLLSDKQYNMTFVVNSNINSSQLMMAFNPEPFDLSVVNTLTFNYSFDVGKSYAQLAVNIAAGAVSSSAVSATEVVTALNANSTFKALFAASVNTDNHGVNYVIVKSLRQRTQFKVYISNSGAESKLRFNKKAGVAEMPLYFDRHTISSITSFPDSLGVLQKLDVSQAIDQAIIADAGLNYTNEQADWELLRGRSGIFNFQKITVDGSDRITTIIEYAAGARVGDLARQIDYVYSGANTKPDQITEIPYVMTSGDLVTPP